MKSKSTASPRRLKTGPSSAVTQARRPPAPSGTALSLRARAERAMNMSSTAKNIFAPWPGEADYYVLWCLLEGVEELKLGLRWAVLDKNSGGISIPSRWNAFAMRGTASHALAYENVRVPARNIVGTGEGIPPSPISYPGSAWATPPFIWASGAAAHGVDCGLRAKPQTPARQRCPSRAILRFSARSGK